MFLLLQAVFKGLVYLAYCSHLIFVAEVAASLLFENLYFFDRHLDRTIFRECLNAEECEQGILCLF